jgi:hypothetical protein
MTCLPHLLVTPMAHRWITVAVRSNYEERHPNPALVVGSWQGDVAVVDSQTGAVRWRRQTDQRLRRWRLYR